MMHSTLIQLFGSHPGKLFILIPNYRYLKTF
jgi:hypothetical protein